jgi:hypothetical protein
MGMSKKKYLAVALTLLALCSVGVAGYSYLTPQTSMPEYVVKFVSGTEYQVGEDGQTIVRLSDKNGIGVVADSCNVSIWYPNKTAWYTLEPMVSGGADGSWYLQWTTQNQIGVYEEYAECVKGDKSYGVSSSFHVSEALTALNETLGEPTLSILS